MLQSRSKQVPGLSAWLDRLTSRKRIQVTAVALANKMARIVWAVLFKEVPYCPPSPPQVSRTLMGCRCAWRKRQAWKSLKGFPHLQSNDRHS